MGTLSPSERGRARSSRRALSELDAALGDPDATAAAPRRCVAALAAGFARSAAVFAAGEDGAARLVAAEGDGVDPGEAVGRVLASGDALAGVERGGAWRFSPPTADEPAAALALPLAARGTTLGVLVVARGGAAPPFSPAERELAARLSRRLALAMDHARLCDVDARLAGIVWLASEAIVSVDPDGRITLFNHGAEQLFGYAAAEMLGEPLERLIPERFRQAHARDVRAFVASGVAARRVDGRRPIVGLRRGGEEFPAEASISRVEVAGRTVLNVVLRDVSEARRVESQLLDALARAQEARAAAEAAAHARDETLRVVAHDIGNSLSAARLHAGLCARLLPADGPTAAARQHATQIVALMTQLQRLRQDLLDAASLEAGALAMRMAPVEVGELVEEALERIAPLAADKEITLASHLPDHLPPVTADMERLLQVMGNLLGNAVRFTPPGGAVTVGATLDDTGAVRVEVADTGPGIAPEHLPHVFDRFWRAPGAGGMGSGLGLAIACGIVRAHGGRLEVESAPGEGTRFAVTLPLPRPAA